MDSIKYFTNVESVDYFSARRVMEIFNSLRPQKRKKRADKINGESTVLSKLQEESTELRNSSSSSLSNDSKSINNIKQDIYNQSQQQINDELTRDVNRQIIQHVQLFDDIKPVLYMELMKIFEQEETKCRLDDDDSLNKQQLITFINKVFGISRLDDVDSHICKSFQDSETHLDTNNTSMSENIHIHSVLLQILIAHEIESNKVPHHCWSRNFSPESMEIISLHANHRMIQEPISLYANWIAFVDIHEHHPLKLDVFLNLLDDLFCKHEKSKKSKFKIPMLKIKKNSRLSRAIELFARSFFKRIKKEKNDHEKNFDHDDELKKLFWKHAYKFFDICRDFILRLHWKIDQGNLIENSMILKKIIDIACRLNKLPVPNDVEKVLFTECIKESLKHGANNYLLEQLDKNSIESKDICQKLKELIKVTQLARNQIRIFDESYETIFSSSELDFLAEEIIYTEFDEIIYTTVKPIILDVVDQNNFMKYSVEDHLMVKVFDLYEQLLRFVTHGTKFNTNRNFKVKDFKKWFHPGAVLWRNLIHTRNIQKIEKAIDKDNFQPEHEGFTFSSSAIDTMQIVYSNKSFWKDLNWFDDIKALVETVSNDFCELITFYVTKFFEKIETELENLKVDELVLPSEVIIALDNFKYVKEHFETMMKNFIVGNIGKTIMSIEMCVEKVQDRINITADLIMELIINKFDQLLQVQMSNISERPANHEEIFHKLSKPLDNIFCTLSPYMHENQLQQTQFNFIDKALIILKELIQNSIKKKKPIEVFVNLDMIIDNLKLLFPQISLNPEISKIIDEIKVQLECYKSSTFSLIQKYYKDCYDIQKNDKIPRYGSITVNFCIVDSTLKLTVSEANLKVDQSFDSFAKVYIISENRQKFKTKIQQNNLCAQYNETFDIVLTTEEVNMKNSIICFKIMKKVSVMYSECFAKSFLVLNDVKEHENINLPLIKEATNDIRLLQLIQQKSLDGDKEAKDFLKKINKS